MDTETEGPMSSRGPPLLGAVAQNSPTSPSSPYPIIGNRRRHIYHRPDCPNYSQVMPHNRVEFNSAVEAEASGYRVAGIVREGEPVPPWEWRKGSKQVKE